MCQKTIPKGRVRKVPLGDMPVIKEPLSTESRNRYVLTIVNFAKRYPEAVSLAKIDTESIAEALLEIYSRVWFCQKF